MAGNEPSSRCVATSASSVAWLSTENPARSMAWPMYAASRTQNASWARGPGAWRGDPRDSAASTPATRRKAWLKLVSDTSNEVLPERGAPGAGHARRARGRSWRRASASVGAQRGPAAPETRGSPDCADAAVTSTRSIASAPPPGSTTEVAFGTVSCARERGRVASRERRLRRTRWPADYPGARARRRRSATRYRPDSWPCAIGCMSRSTPNGRTATNAARCRGVGRRRRDRQAHKRQRLVRTGAVIGEPACRIASRPAGEKGRFDVQIGRVPGAGHDGQVVVVQAGVAGCARPAPAGAPRPGRTARS